MIAGKKDFLKLLDLEQSDILEILELAERLKKGEKNQALAGKSVGLIFEKSSTRTRVSFEIGVHQLGGYPLFLSSAHSQLGRGEPIEDTARVLSRYLDGIMIRTFGHDRVEALAKYASVPVINGLTDLAHPCQVLADLQTIKEHKGKLEGLKMAYIGDGNNMANSLIAGGLKVGMEVACASPAGYEPDASVRAYAEKTGRFTLTTDVLEAARDADVLFTDVWASMGQEDEAAARRKVFEGVYQINDKVMAVAAKGAMVQHCLPAHRGEEITADVFEAHAGEIFDEAENRLHAQKAVMVKLMGE